MDSTQHFLSQVPIGRPSSSGTYLEGVGDEVVVAFMSVFVLGITFLGIFLRYKHVYHLSSIHPESTDDVNVARTHLQIEVDGANSDALTSDETTDHSNQQRSNQQHYYTDRKCPICLLESRLAVETNCGHLFCGRCIITYWRYGDWLGAMQCPVCRQFVSLLMREFLPDEDAAARREIDRDINEYNRRFSGQPRQLLDYVWDLPAILRHVWREFFSVGGLVMMFRCRIIFCVVAVIVYLLSPLDILPEAVLGIIGLLDDLFVILLVLIYITIIYRQIVAERGH